MSSRTTAGFGNDRLGDVQRFRRPLHNLDLQQPAVRSMMGLAISASHHDWRWGPNFPQIDRGALGSGSGALFGGGRFEAHFSGVTLIGDAMD